MVLLKPDYEYFLPATARLLANFLRLRPAAPQRPCQTCWGPGAVGSPGHCNGYRSVPADPDGKGLARYFGRRASTKKPADRCRPIACQTICPTRVCSRVWSVW